MTDVPIACSLTASGREQRAALVARLAADALLGREQDGDSLVLRFRSALGVERRVREWAALEVECCPFLTMTVVTGGSEVTLRIDGPPGAGSVIEDLLPLSRAVRTNGGRFLIAPPNGG
jgi:hypothetical protein